MLLLWITRNHRGSGPGWPIKFEDANRFRGWSRELANERTRKDTLSKLVRKAHGWVEDEPPLPAPVAQEIRQAVPEAAKAPTLADLILVRAILAKYERDLMDEDDEEALLLV